jgi:hypothetical protein
MLYKFNANYINLAEIASLSCTASNDTEYPYTLTVFLKDGNKYGVRYTTEQARNAEAWNIMQAHNKTDPEPVSRYEVETIVSSEGSDQGGQPWKLRNSALSTLPRTKRCAVVKKNALGGTKMLRRAPFSFSPEH